MEPGRPPASTLLSRDQAFLLVVDVQEPLMRLVWESERVTTNVGILLRAAQVLGLPVVVTVQNRERLGETIPEVAAHLPPEYPVLNKMTFSCMRDPDISRAIHATGRHQAIVCGVETHVCVHQTAHDLIAHGFQTHVVADAVSSRRQSNWLTAISRMERAGIIITSTEMALYELLERAGTPAFRAVLPLVK